MSREPLSPGARAVITPATAVTAVSASSSFDERWDAWQMKGVAHDRAVRRKLAIAAPIVVVVAAAIFYALVGR